MKNSRLDQLSRLPASVAFSAMTLCTLALAGNTFAASTVAPKEQNYEQPRIEKSAGADSHRAELSTASIMAAAPYERYIIALVDDAVASYRGGVAGYQASSTEGKSKLNVRSSAAVAYRDYLAMTQDELLISIERQIGRAVAPLAKLQVASNVLVLELTAAEAQQVAQLKGIRQVQKDKLFQLEATTAFDGYALDVKPSSSISAGALAIAMLALLAITLLAYRRGWIGRNSAAFAAIVASLGMAGCYYEGGFAWIGAPSVWHGSRDIKPTMGEGVVVGIIDTGINPISDSFAAVDADGYRHDNPKGKYYGVCDPESSVYDASFPCNDKLIGAWGWPLLDEGNARDVGGHGSHTAGTSAGNIVYGATVVAPSGFEISKDIAGVSPHSNVISYKVCGEDGCSLAAILFAINQAILDGVDVINYSIGGGARNPWYDEDALSFLAAMDAGIFVATSAGNSGPDAATVGSPADAPWITSVGASSHDYLYASTLFGLTNDQGDVLENMIGQAIAPGIGVSPIVDAADYGNPLCLEDQFSAPFNGEMVICEAGEIARVDKGKNVVANGAVAMIITRPNTTPDGSGYLEADTHAVPAVQINYTNVTKLREWLATGSGHRGAITGTRVFIAPEMADVMAFFSSRGEDPSVPGVLKPNVTAPGRAIFAAYYEGYSEAEQDYNIIQGTSMSSPHVAGSGALMTALHPQWTPMQIQSALMTTANPFHRKEDGETPADPFDMGAGRVDLPLAARAALLLDEDLAGFVAANPLTGGDPRALNLTGLSDAACVVKCSWTRTVTNVSKRTTHWHARNTEAVTVEPQFFSLTPGESTQLTFTASTADVAIDDWLFDQVLVESMSRHAPHAHFPVAAKSKLAELPRAIEITAVQETDSVTLGGLKAIEITAATVAVTGLAPSTIYTGALVSDPTNGTPYDGGFDPTVAGQQLFMLDIPEGATRLVAQITESASVDLDLFIGTGETPSDATELARSATGSALEYISYVAPPAGKLWVVVQNWQAGATEPQAYTLHLAVVEGDAGNMTVAAPLTQPAGEPFSLDIGFQLPGSVAGERFYGSFSLGSNAANPGNLGTIEVDLVRQ